MNNTYLNTALQLVGRVFLSAIFLWSGVGKIGDFSGTTEYMASKGMPLPSLFLLGAIFLELAGGLSLLLGFKARWGALLLVAFLVPTTLMFHAFWAVEEASRRMETIQFMKNLAILGGLFMVMANGAQRAGVDALLKRS